MMQSLYTAVTGLRTHQTKMDVIGNNVANVNTVGYKKSRMTFADIFYQTMKGGALGEAGTIGGTNPQQIGFGVGTGSVEAIHSQGSAQGTGLSTDLMIQGDGFFMVTDGTNYYFTRAGAFTFDESGILVQVGTGMRVVGVDDNGDESNVQLPDNVQSFSIDTLGRLNYIDDSGDPQLGETVAVAKFPNPGGLKQAGRNLFQWGPSAGQEINGDITDDQLDLVFDELVPGNNSRGTILSGSLELSNVELAQEFTDMITTQRGFQANARMITVSDEMLQELANLKR